MIGLGITGFFVCLFSLPMGPCQQWTVVYSAFYNVEGYSHKASMSLVIEIASCYLGGRLRKGN